MLGPVAATLLVCLFQYFAHFVELEDDVAWQRLDHVADRPAGEGGHDRGGDGERRLHQHRGEDVGQDVAQNDGEIGEADRARLLADGRLVATADVAWATTIAGATETRTVALAAAGASVKAYEIDTGLRPLLEEVTSGMDVELRTVDVMTVDLSRELIVRPWKLVGNLAFTVGTPMQLDALRQELATIR